MTNANAAYLAKLAEVQANLKALEAHIQAHAAKQAKDSKNWGFAGDLDTINDHLLYAMNKKG